MKKLLPLLLLVPSLARAEANHKPLVECGEFQRIYNPSWGEDRAWCINDHAIIYGTDGLWHLIGITHEEPAIPWEERIFAHATSPDLRQKQWTKQPSVLAYAPEAPWNEKHVWAPDIKLIDGTYYMYYCAGGEDPSKFRLHLATSKDTKTWVRSPENPMVVDGSHARDPFLLKRGDQWLMYYTATSEPTGGNHVVACVTSSDLVNWSDRKIVFSDPSTGKGGGNTESPFVVQRGDQWYLFIGPRGGYDGTDVFVSKDPLHWDIENKVGHFPAHAAEVIRDLDGQWYISRAGWARGGAYLAPLTWNDGLENPETNIGIPKKLNHQPQSSAAKASAELLASFQSRSTQQATRIADDFTRADTAFVTGPEVSQMIGNHWKENGTTRQWAIKENSLKSGSDSSGEVTNKSPIYNTALKTDGLNGKTIFTLTGYVTLVNPKGAGGLIFNYDENTKSGITFTFTTWRGSVRVEAPDGRLLVNQNGIPGFDATRAYRMTVISTTKNFYYLEIYDTFVKKIVYSDLVTGRDASGGYAGFFANTSGIVFDDFQLETGSSND